MGNGQWAGTGGEALGTGHKALGGEEELFESLAFASELEGMVGAAVGAGGLLLVCGWAGCGSEGVDWRGGSPTPRPSPPGEAGGGDWFSKRAREKSSRMGLVFRRRVDCDARRDVRVACVVFIPVIVGMAGAGAMGRSGWDGSLRALPILLQSRLHPVINRIFQPVNHVGKHATILPPPALKKTLADPSVYHRSPCFVAAVQVAKAGTISALPTHKLSSGVTTWSTYRALA